MNPLPAKTILESVKELTSLHEGLHAIALQKTEMIKTGDLDRLQSILKEENLYIKQIRQTEGKLVQETQTFLEKSGASTESPSLSKVIDLVEDKTAFMTEKTKLETQIEALRQQNLLNQDLLEQSLQFVQMNLELLQPDIDSFNYNRPEVNQESPHPKRSIFDSNA